jgi:DNA polymerase
MAEMVAYCEQDVKVMRAVSTAMRPLSKIELADYHVNERINDRGILIDTALCKAAVEYASDELGEIQSLVDELTEGAVKSVRSPTMRDWVFERVGEQGKKLMTTYKDDVKKYSIDKTVRANLLVLAEENNEEIPSIVADVIQCADDLWASSVAKFSRLAGLADHEDHRVRGAFVFAGGAATGRASSYGAQVHNFTRKCATDPDSVRQAMVRGHSIVPKFGRRVTDVLKGMLRPAMIPKADHVFVVADWSAIEGRVHPWLANTRDGEVKLDVFRSGLDPYKVNASATFHVAYDDVTGEQRQVGKVQELALGFLGGAGAFEMFGRVYGVRMTENEIKRAVNGWRRANPWAMEHGQKLENAYTKAVRNPSIEFSAGRVTYMFDGLHLWYALPSGRVLCYPYAKLEPDGLSYAKAAWKPAADATEWPRARLWRGLACENITQASANDILRYALRELDARQLDAVLHVHDEIVVECPKQDADAVQATMSEIMCTAPDWATGLPLAIDIKVMERYGKG